jgi:flagellar hook-length control protein FliK
MQFGESGTMSQLMTIISTNLNPDIAESMARHGKSACDSFNEHFEAAQRDVVTSTRRQRHDEISKSTSKDSGDRDVAGTSDDIDTEALARHGAGKRCDEVDSPAEGDENKVEDEYSQDDVESAEELLTEAVAAEGSIVVIAPESNSQANQTGQSGQDAAKADGGRQAVSQLLVKPEETAGNKSSQNMVKVDSDAAQTAAEKLGLTGQTDATDGQSQDKAVKQNTADTLSGPNAQKDSRFKPDVDMMQQVDEAAVSKDESASDGKSQTVSNEKVSQAAGNGLMNDLSGGFSAASQFGKGSSSTLPENNQSSQSGQEFSILNEANTVGKSLGHIASEKPDGVSQVDMQGNVDRVVKAAKAVVARGSSTIQLRLDPPDLGTLRIEMRHDSSGLTMQLQATNARAHQLLQQNAGELRAALEASGIQTNKIDIQLRLDLQNDDNSSGQGGYNYHASDQGGSGQSGFSGSEQNYYGSGEGQSEYSYSPDLSLHQEEASSVELAGVGQWQELEFGSVDIQV